MDTVGTVKIEFWAVVLGATDAILIGNAVWL